jgi:magnesium transporter
MTTEFVSVPSDWTVGRTLDYIRKVERTRETIYAIYIVDPETHVLVRSTGLRRLISGEPDDLVMDVAPDRAPVTVSPLTESEKVAQLISKYDLLAVPVVDHGKILGIVTIDDIIDTMIEETTEDGTASAAWLEALTSLYMKMPSFRCHDPETRRLAQRPLHQRDADRQCDAGAGEGESARRSCSPCSSLLIMSSGGNSGAAGDPRLSSGRRHRARSVFFGDWWRVARASCPRASSRSASRSLAPPAPSPHRAVAVYGFSTITPALAADRHDGRRGAGRHRHLRGAVGINAPPSRRNGIVASIPPARRSPVFAHGWSMSLAW